ncbi:Aspyridones efflux protein apdF [Golovinomyces cichoracearum]|uniref:Aspyridones efflux protein apdF n=1 Tax=Golovinomyces cichoracearum TaxID=62708 RepID=A0A420IPQ7_9PEZI|nr:Aspyridones efflux protein apdF [Golovinomyces cichoracearum]
MEKNNSTQEFSYGEGLEENFFPRVVRDVETFKTDAKSGSEQSSLFESEELSDGGSLAWTQALLCHLVMFSTWGVVNSFGTFQHYYHTTILADYDPSSISWIGSTQVFLLFFVGALTGHLSDMGFFRLLLLVGSVMIVVGMLMTSFAVSYWQLFFSQGVCIGLGNGCLFCPSLSVLSTYFNRRRGIAMGICATGSATGGMVYSALFSRLLPAIGFPWTIRVAALIQLVCLTACNLGLKQRVIFRKSRKVFDYNSLKDLPFIIFCLGMFFNLWGVYFVAHYISLFATAILGLSFQDSVNILIVLNGVGILGRILPNIIADYFLGSFNVLILICICCGALSFSWIAVTDRGSLYAWAAFYGIFSSGIQSLYPAALFSITNDPKKSGSRMGMFLTFISFTALTGAPIAGELVQRHGGKYLQAQLFSGTTIVVGSGFLAVARLLENRKLLVKL